ncbi:hypothetical protein QNH14_09060 [Apirhabdus apintestini]|nr:hypothetical protein QNH14_09060 [Enterobacteriaceae bacterium CA-0114]
MAGALDTATERESQTILREISADRTTLIIAHRISCVMDADEIPVLEKGPGVERGSHANLLRPAVTTPQCGHRSTETARVIKSRKNSRLAQPPQLLLAVTFSLRCGRWMH